LEAEGFAREIIRRIQQMRKDMGLNVEEFIRTEIECSPKVEAFIDTWKDHISRETRARQFETVTGPKGDYIVEWNVASEALLVGVTSLKMKQNIDAIAAIPGMSVDKAIKLHEAGYKSLDALKAAKPNDVATVGGLSQGDAMRIYDYLHREEARPAAPAVSETLAPSPAEAAAPAATTYTPHATYLDKLRTVEGLDEQTATALLEAGYVSSQTIKSTTIDDLVKVNGISVDLAGRLMDTFAKVVDEVNRPAPAAAKAPPTLAELERSFTYLVEEDKPETSYNLFVKTLGKGMKGFCVTRNYPAKIRSKFDMKDTPVIWLSNVGRDNAIRPKDLEKLSISLEQFLSQAGGGIVLLDGLEYLITNNNFITVLRLIQSLRDQVAINQSILLMAVNRSTLESHQLNLLEREVDYTITG
jgi:hypothetical protein